MKAVKRVGSGWSCASVGLLHALCATFKDSDMHRVASHRDGRRSARDEARVGSGRYTAGEWPVGSLLVTVVRRQLSELAPSNRIAIE